MKISSGFSSPSALQFGSRKRNHATMERGVSESNPIVIDDDNDRLDLSSRHDDGNESDFSNRTVTQEGHRGASRKGTELSAFLRQQSAKLNTSIEAMFGRPSSVDLSKESKESMESYIKTARISMKIAKKEPLTTDEQNHWQKRKMEMIEDEVMNQFQINREQARQVLMQLQEESGSS